MRSSTQEAALSSVFSNKLSYHNLGKPQFCFCHHVLPPGGNKYFILYYKCMAGHQYGFIVIRIYHLTEHFSCSHVNGDAVGIAPLPEIGYSFHLVTIFCIYIIDRSLSAPGYYC